MKLTSYLLIILSIAFNSCLNGKKEVNYVVLSGTIKSPDIDSLKLYDKDFKPIQTIYFSKDLSFNDTLFISEGYYYLGDFKTSTKLLFLKPSYNLNADIKSFSEDDSIIFQGNGSNENNYLQKKKTYNKTFKPVENYKYFLTLNEERFLKLSDSIYSEKTNFLNSFENLDNDFKNYESFTLKFENSSFIDRYSLWKGEFIGDKNFSVSKDFPNPYTNYNLSDEKMLLHPNYLNSIAGALKSKHKIMLRFQDVDLKFLKILDNEISSEIIKDEIAYNYVKEGIEQTNDLDNVYNLFMSIVKNETYKDAIKKSYLNPKKLSKGKISPTFEFFDVNNNLVTLESLKGKLVYIDIWGTWCIPCIQEIPALKEIELEFREKDIYFVSICIRDKKENFLNFVKERKLSGIQLFAPDIDIPFFKDYQLKTVPRFILIDKEGKIIDANTTKPSDPKLKEQILEYL
ncbi:MAG: TlpA disulfide reductase family protein [Lutibacter sp.]|nr:TlpA disulfide reductase family protein [Lutibacter sp.]